MTSIEKAENIVKILDEKKAVGIRVLRISDLTAISDYFVVANGTSTTHIRALADEVDFRKSVCVKAYGKKYIVALHPALSGNNLKTGICLDMSHMHSCAGRVRKLYKSVKLRFIRIVLCMENSCFFPLLLPFCLIGFKIVWFHLLFHSFELICKFIS